MLFEQRMHILSVNATLALYIIVSYWAPSEEEFLQNLIRVGQSRLTKRRSASLSYRTIICTVVVYIAQVKGPFTGNIRSMGCYEMCF